MKCTLKEPSLRSIALILPLLLVAACLPERSSGNDALIDAQADTYAAYLSSAAASREARLLTSPEWLNGTLGFGHLGHTEAGNVAHAYCPGFTADGDPFLLSWLTDTDGGDRFATPMLGLRASAAIVSSLAKRHEPSAIGHVRGKSLHPVGRVDGSTEQTLPAGCDTLPIPHGAPFIIATQLEARAQEAVEAAAYEYRTIECGGDEAGFRTERRPVRSWPDGSSTSGSWETYDETCGGMESIRSVTITTAEGHFTGVIDFGSGEVQSELSRLAGGPLPGETIYCARVQTDEELRDEDGRVVAREGAVIADSCVAADAVDLETLQALGEAEVDKNRIVDEKIAQRACGPGVRSFAGSHQGFSGSVSTPGWSGLVTYLQPLYHASVAQAGSSGSAYATTAQWGDWQGAYIDCQRDETLTLSCAQVFPHYAALRPLRADGIALTKKNSIDGWEDAVAMRPRLPSTQPHEGWSNPRPRCEWLEEGSYSCCEELGRDWTLAAAGRKERDIVAVDLGRVNYGEWRDVSASRCSQRYEHCWNECVDVPAPNGETRRSCSLECEWRTRTSSLSLAVCEGNNPPDRIDHCPDIPGIQTSPADCGPSLDACPDMPGFQTSRDQCVKSSCNYASQICNLFSSRALGNYLTMFGRQADNEGALFWTNVHHDLAGVYQRAGMTAGEAMNHPAVLAELDRLMMASGRLNGETILPNARGSFSDDMPANSMFNPRVIGNYRSMMGRELDAEGAFFWTNALHDKKLEFGAQIAAENPNLTFEQVERLANQRSEEWLDRSMYLAAADNKENMISDQGSYGQAHAGTPRNVAAINALVTGFYEEHLGRVPSNENGGLIYWQNRLQQLIVEHEASGGNYEDSLARAWQRMESEMHHAAEGNGEIFTSR